MTYQFPEYNEIKDYEYYQGSLSFAFIKKHCEDVVIVTPEEWKDYKDYTWLDQLLSKHLANNKKILLVPDEETFIFPPQIEAQQVLNCYQDHDVWLVTQLGIESQLIYKFQHQLTIKLLELPYVLLDLCEKYYKHHGVQDLEIAVEPGQYNFLCLSGRYEPHKANLLKELAERNLSQQGLITMASLAGYPDWCKKICKINKLKYPAIVGEHLFQRLADHNVYNFFQIEKTYANIPLIVHAESSCGIFYTTEKSLWPLLLGKLYLGFGPPGNMKYIQKFYDVDINEYANLDYDCAPGNWTQEEHYNRLKTMLNQNHNLIYDCKDLYDSLSLRLESARWTMGKNFYNFFVEQLKTI